MQGAKYQVACLGGLDGCGQGLLITYFPNQDYIGVLSKGCPQGVVEHLGVLTNLPVSNQRLATFMYEFDRIFDGENMAAHVAIDPVDHRGKGGALAGAGGARNQDHSLGPGRQLLEHWRQVEIFHGGDLLGDQPQHHRRTPQRIQQVDAHSHKGKGVGAVEFLLALEGVDFNGAEHLSHPAAEGGRISHGPTGASHLPPGPEAGFLSNSQVHVGVAPLVGYAHDAFEAVGLAAVIYPGGGSSNVWGGGRGRRSGRCCGWGDR